MRNTTRYVLIILGVLIVIIIAVIIFNVINRPSNKNTESSTAAPTSLSTYADTAATVSYTIGGVIRGNDQYRAIKITVSNTGRTIQILSGYQGQILKSQTTPNNIQAYQQFLAAIQNQGFLSQRTNPTATNMEGQCPLGNRFIVASTNIPNIPASLWSSTCGAKSGTWAGSNTNVSRLFQLQIPNYNQFISGVVL